MYRIAKNIRSCRIEVATVQALESLILRYLKENSRITITLTDHFGEEEFKSFQDYGKEYFPNSIREIDLYCRDSDMNGLVKIKLNKNQIGGGSYLLIELENKDNAIELYRKITDIFNEDATMNWLIRWDNKFLLLHGALTGIFTLSVSFLIYVFLKLILHRKIELNVGIIICILMLSIFMIGIPRIPYINFRTKQSDQRGSMLRNFLWAVLIILLGIWVARLFNR